MDLSVQPVWSKQIGESNFRLVSLCTSLHKDTYAQFPVMNSFASVVLAVVSVKGQTRGLCPLHNYRFFKNSRSDSVALKRRAGTPGSCRRARAFSFMAKSASTY